jgi:hypothetical protein
MKPWVIAALCLTGLLLMASAAWTAAGDLRSRLAPTRPAAGRYQLQTVVDGGTVRHFAFDTAAGQLYVFTSRSLPAGRVEYVYEPLGPAVGGD